MSPPPGMPEGIPAFWGVSFAVEDADATAALAVERGGTMLSGAVGHARHRADRHRHRPVGRVLQRRRPRQLDNGARAVASPRPKLRVLDARRSPGPAGPRVLDARRSPGPRVHASSTRRSPAPRRASRRGASLPAATPRPPTRDHAWPRRLYLLAEGEPPGLALPEHARRVRVTSAPVVAFWLDQHVLAQRRQVLIAERAAIRRRLEVLRRPDRPPPWRVGHPLMVAIQRPGVVHPLRLAGCEPAWRGCRPRSPCELWIESRPGAGGILVLIPPSSFLSRGRLVGAPARLRNAGEYVHARPTARGQGQWLRSASMSSLLFILERPSMPISAARFSRSPLFQSS